MNAVLKVTNLNYQDFKDINLDFNRGNFYSVVGGSNSGKTTLFRLLSSLIPTSNVICCNGITFNKTNTKEYLLNIGIVERLNKRSFIYKKVIDEMEYPLINLGYEKNKRIDIINKSLKFFGVMDFINKNISELNNYQKQLLLIIISLLHSPKVILLDSVLDFFSNKEREKIIKLLKKLNKRGLTVINFTKKLDLLVDKFVLLDKYSVIGEFEPTKIYEDDKLFYSHGLEIPFIIDLSIKLKMYDLVDKEYFNMKEMVDDIWL